jgi:hypothetical protein
MIKEILNTHRGAYPKGSKLAFKCGSTNGIRRFVDICYDEKIEFSKSLSPSSSKKPHVFEEILKDQNGYTTYLESFLEFDQDTVILFITPIEFQFYTRRESDWLSYNDTNEFEVLDFTALIRDEKLNKLLS